MRSFYVGCHQWDRLPMVFVVVCVAVVGVSMFVSHGVVGSADCGPGVKPGGWLIDFWRTSRIFSCKLCLFGNISLCLICVKWASIQTINTMWPIGQSNRHKLQMDQWNSNNPTWNSVVSFELGNIPDFSNRSMTSWRRCSNILRWPFSAATSCDDRDVGLFALPIDWSGVRGERSVSFVFKSKRKLREKTKHENFSSNKVQNKTAQRRSTYLWPVQYWSQVQKIDSQPHLAVWLWILHCWVVVHLRKLYRKETIVVNSWDQNWIKSVRISSRMGWLTWFGRKWWLIVVVGRKWRLCGLFSIILWKYTRRWWHWYSTRWLTIFWLKTWQRLELLLKIHLP